MASASNAFASGFGVIADQENSAVFGQFNTTEQTNLLFVVGNGSDNTARSDAFTISEDGNATIAGSTTIGGELSVGGIEVAAMINDLLNAVDSLQSTIGAMQEQIDLLNNGE